MQLCWQVENLVIVSAQEIIDNFLFILLIFKVILLRIIVSLYIAAASQFAGYFEVSLTVSRLVVIHVT